MDGGTCTLCRDNDSFGFSLSFNRGFQTLCWTVVWKVIRATVVPYGTYVMTKDTVDTLNRRKLRERKSHENLFGLIFSKREASTYCCSKFVFFPKIFLNILSSGREGTEIAKIQVPVKILESFSRLTRLIVILKIEIFFFTAVRFIYLFIFLEFY